MRPPSPTLRSVGCVGVRLESSVMPKVMKAEEFRLPERPVKAVQLRSDSRRRSKTRDSRRYQLLLCSEVRCRLKCKNWKQRSLSDDVERAVRRPSCSRRSEQSFSLRSHSRIRGAAMPSSIHRERPSPDRVVLRSKSNSTITGRFF